MPVQQQKRQIPSKEKVASMEATTLEKLQACQSDLDTLNWSKDLLNKVIDFINQRNGLTKQMISCEEKMDQFKTKPHRPVYQLSLKNYNDAKNKIGQLDQSIQSFATENPDLIKDHNKTGNLVNDFNYIYRTVQRNIDICQATIANCQRSLKQIDNYKNHYQKVDEMNSQCNTIVQHGLTFMAEFNDIYAKNPGNFRNIYPIQPENIHGWGKMSPLEKVEIIVGFHRDYIMALYKKSNISLTFCHFRGHPCFWNVTRTTCDCETDYPTISNDCSTHRFFSNISSHIEKFGGFCIDPKLPPDSQMDSSDVHFIGYIEWDDDTHDPKSLDRVYCSYKKDSDSESESDY